MPAPLSTNKEDDKPKKLTVKQRRFVEEYCKDFNATRAAIESGYSESVAYQQGYENLRKPEIKKEVDMRLAALTMTADEALLRMSDFARGSFTPFVSIDDKSRVMVDLASLPARQNIHLIKKLKQTKRTFGDGDDNVITEVYTEIELHDAKDATKTILQMHGKLVDKKTLDITSDGQRIPPTTIIFGKGSRDHGNDNQ
jgi:phage terminase small subunit